MASALSASPSSSSTAAGARSSSASTGLLLAVAAAAALGGAAASFAAGVALGRRRRGRSASVAPLQPRSSSSSSDDAATSPGAAAPLAPLSPGLLRDPSSPASMLVTPTPSFPAPRAFSSLDCPCPLPEGVTIRSATPEDHEAVASLVRFVGRTQRGGLAREEGEMDGEYVAGIMHALEGGVLLVAVASASASAAAAAGSSAHTFTTSCGGALVGMLKASRIGPHRCFQHVLSDCTLAVHPSWQRQGIAQQLFAALFRRVSLPEYQHVLRVELIARESNVHALRMYERVGFRVNAKLHARIVTSPASTSVPVSPVAADATHAQEQPAPLTAPSMRFESDVVMVWFNPAFDEQALARKLQLIDEACSVEKTRA